MSSLNSRATFLNYAAPLLFFICVVSACSNSADLNLAPKSTNQEASTGTQIVAVADATETKPQIPLPYAVELIDAPSGNYDTYVGPLAEQYRPLLDSLYVTSYSPAEADENDLVIEAPQLIEPTPFRLVVRKPSSTGGTLKIESIPKNPVKAWTYVQDQIEKAAESRVAKILFPASQEIRLQNPGQQGQTAHLPLEGLSDVEIDLNGSTLIYTTKGPGLILKDCQRVTIKNGKISGSFMVASIATVEYDSSQAGLKFRLLPPFTKHFGAKDELKKEELPTVYTIGKAEEYGKTWRIDAHEARDLFTNREQGLNQFHYKTEKLNGKLTGYFVSTSPTDYTVRPFAEGQLVYLLHENNSAHGIVLKNDDGNVEDITLTDLVLENIPGMGIAGEINRGLHVNRVSIIPNPNDPTSFLGSSSDGFHINNNGGDILFENNILGGSADDLFTAKGNWWEIKESDRKQKTLTVGNAGDKKYSVNLWANPGDTLVLVEPNLLNIETATTSKRSIEGKKRTHEAYLTQLPGIGKEGTLIANTTLSGGRMVIRNNTFSSSRAQGILAQTQHILIENNEFENIAGPAIKINQSLNDWYEGVYTHNILVRNNNMIDVAQSLVKPPHPIYITGQHTMLEKEVSPLIETIGILGNNIN